MDSSGPGPVVEWLREQAVPLAGCEPGSGLADLRPLAPMFAGARVVGLGEATHGTREFFQLKHRLVELLACELGFGVFAIEASLPDAIGVDEYVQGLRDDAAAVLTGMRFWTWDTQEVLALLQWLRSVPRPMRMRFCGFDMQHPSTAVLKVIDRLRPQEAAEARRRLAWLGNDDRARSFAGLSPRRRAGVVRFAEQLCTALDDDPNAVVVRQAAALLHDLRGAAATREQSMAANIAAVSRSTGRPVVAWAHNGHVQRTGVAGSSVLAMGGHLRSTFGAAYVPVGFVFNRGGFRAQALPGGGMTDFVVGPGPEGSLDRAMAAVGLPVFAVDLRRAPTTGPVADWLASAPLTRSVGSAYAYDRDHRFWRGANPRDAFDVLVFVDETSPARANRPPALRSRAPARHRAPVNLDFAQGRVGTVPPGWSAAVGPAAGAYRVARVDCGAEVSRLDGPWRWGVGRLSQRLDARPYRGTLVRLSVEARADSLDHTAEAQVRLEATGPGGAPGPHVDLGLGGVRSSRWRRYQVELAVPADARDLTVCFQLAGHGRLVVRRPVLSR
jgi:erythromycin esterase